MSLARVGVGLAAAKLSLTRAYFTLPIGEIGNSRFRLASLHGQLARMSAFISWADGCDKHSSAASEERCCSRSPRLFHLI